MLLLRPSGSFRRHVRGGMTCVQRCEWGGLIGYSVFCSEPPPPFRSQIRLNEAIIAEKMAEETEPMSYYRAFKDVVSVLPRDAVIVRKPDTITAR